MSNKKTNSMVSLISMHLKLKLKSDNNFHEQLECDELRDLIYQKWDKTISKFHNSISHNDIFRFLNFFLENPKISAAMLAIWISILVGGSKKIHDIRKNRDKTKNGIILSNKIEKRKKKFSILKNTGTKKQCGRCGILKPYREFYLTKDRYGKYILRNFCKTCNNILRNIRRFAKKMTCILTIFPKPCSNCEIDDVFIPVFNFHHLDPSIKTETWAVINSRNTDYIRDWIKRERVISLCNNCHNLVHSKYLNQEPSRDIILDPELYLKSSSEIRQIVKDRTLDSKNIGSLGNRRGKILEWIRKRFVIETLIGNSCPGCGLNVLDNLGAFEMHHLNPELKNSKYSEIEYKTIPQILRILMDEQCIWLCSNCHSLITSNFEQRAKESFELIYLPETVAKKLIIVEERYSKINNAIKDYKPNIADIDYDPLFYVHKDNLWKYNFIRLHELYPISFQTNQFRDNICEHYRKFMIKYKNLGLVERLYPDYKKRGYFRYTNKGINIIPQFQYDIDMSLIDRRKKKSINIQ